MSYELPPWIRAPIEDLPLAGPSSHSAASNSTLRISFGPQKSARVSSADGEMGESTGQPDIAIAGKSTFTVNLASSNTVVNPLIGDQQIQILAFLREVGSHVDRSLGPTNHGPPERNIQSRFAHVSCIQPHHIGCTTCNFYQKVAALTRGNIAPASPPQLC